MPAFPASPRLPSSAPVLRHCRPRALDEYVRAYSLRPSELRLCGEDGALASSGACKDDGFRCADQADR